MDALRHRSWLPRRDSLRWRLPVLSFALIIVVLGAFLWAAYEEVEHTLIEAGQARAQAAADQLANLLAPSLRQRTVDLRRVAGDPALRRFLVDQNEATRRAAETSLRRLVTSGQYVTELWDRHDTRLMAIANAPTTEATFPPASAPVGDGLRLARRGQGPVVSDLTERIQPDDVRRPESHVGYLVLRRPVSTSPTDVLNKLVGGGARVELGGKSGSWTDFGTVVPAPPVDLSHPGVREYRSGNGEARLGALAEIAQTPWLVWVEFPRGVFLAPARTFLSRTVLVAVAFAVVAGVLSLLATARITKPLAALTDASEAIAAGDYGQRVTTSRSDEIGRLATAFNAMVSRIQDAQERLVLAVQGSKIGIWEWHANSDRVMLSPEWKRLLGYADSEIDGSPLLMRQLVHPDDADAVIAGIRACLKGDTDTWESEHRLRQKDGSYCWVLARGVAYRNTEGQPIRLAGTSIDITAQKRAQAEATGQARQAAFVADVAVALTEGRELRHMLRRCAQAMVEHLDAAVAQVWTANLTEQVLELQATAGLAGDFESNLQRIPIGAFTVGRVAAEGRPIAENAIENLTFASDALVKREGLSSYAGFPLVLGDQLVGVLSMFGRQPLADSTLIALGSVARTVALGIERKRLEEARSRFEDLLESATDFVTIGQPSGPALYINRAAREAFGMGPTEHVPSLLAFRPAGFRDFFEHTMLPSASREGVWKGESEYVSRAGRVIPVSQVSVAHKNAAGQIAYISTISRDISDERRVAREREELEEQLRRAQKIEAIGQLAGGLAHDFNNLLTIILGYSHVLGDQFEEHDPRRADIDQIRKAGDRAAQLTRQLLAFSRKQILHPVVLNPNDLIREVSPMLERLLGEHIVVALNCAPDVNAITFDPAQMELILVNLAVNARDAMPQGGRFTIETANVDLDEEFTRTHLSVEAGLYVQLSVSDTGLGMDEATRTRIFEPFFTTKAVGKGTGLGLATVFGIVKQSGGSIWVYSEPGLGASFKIFLPAIRDPKVIQAVRAPRRAPTGHETVLVVEDEPGVRVLVQTLLQRAGYRILSAAHPAEALQIAADPSQLIDLLLTDVVMPDLNGAALFVRIREARPTLRVLFMSGFANEAIEHHGVLAAGTPFLQKPFTGVDLACAIRAALDQRGVSEPGLDHQLTQG